MQIQEAIGRVIARQDLDTAEMQAVMRQVMSGQFARVESFRRFLAAPGDMLVRADNHQRLLIDRIGLRRRHVQHGKRQAARNRSIGQALPFSLANHQQCVVRPQRVIEAPPVGQPEMRRAASA